MCLSFPVKKAPDLFMSHFTMYQHLFEIFLIFSFLLVLLYYGRKGGLMSPGATACRQVALIVAYIFLLMRFCNSVTSLLFAMEGQIDPSVKKQIQLGLFLTSCMAIPLVYLEYLIRTLLSVDSHGRKGGLMIPVATACRQGALIVAVVVFNYSVISLLLEGQIDQQKQIQLIRAMVISCMAISLVYVEYLIITVFSVDSHGDFGPSKYVSDVWKRVYQWLPKFEVSLGTTNSKDEGVSSQRASDEETLRSLLLSPVESESSSMNYSLVAIVGKEGIGKTTLTRLVFINNLIMQNFELRSWACFSSDFNSVTEELLEYVTHDQACSVKQLSLDELQFRLQMLIHRKQCLIVLDDVSIEGASDLDKLLAPFKNCAKGSKIVFTMSNEDVVRFMNNCICYSLHPLMFDDSCWATSIAKMLPQHEEFRRLTEEIITKCGGLPLLVKVLVGILQKQDIQTWKEVLNNEIWGVVQEEQGISNVLSMIYDYLPGHLKPCFEYFSLFPIKYNIPKDTLLSVWIAEGFVPHSTDYSLLLTSASQIFDELQCSNLIERDMSMHHLIRELSCLVCSKYYCKPGIGHQQATTIDKFTHVSLLGTKIDATDIEWLIQAKSLCTIFLESGPLKFWSEFLDRLPNWKSLRVMHLSEADGMVELPSSISELDQLQCLRLYRCGLTSLPSSICYLSNLQTLEVEFCSGLSTLPEEFGYLSSLCRLNLSRTGISSLPKSFYNLTNLRELNLSETEICSLSESVCRLNKLEKLQVYQCRDLSGFPPQLKALTQLRCLSNYSVGEGETYGGIEVLKDLNKLEGAICISGLENIGSREEARTANLRNKEFLQELTLQWSPRPSVTNDRDLEIAQGLLPFSCVKSVSFVDYAGEIFPDWLSRMGSLTDLHVVRICGCSRVRTLHLPYKDLRKVEIRECPQLKSLILQLADCSKPEMKIEELIIVDCPNLESIPERALCIKRNLQIHDCGKLEINLDCLVNMLDLASLEQLHVKCDGTHLTFKQLNVIANLSLSSLPQRLSSLTSLRLIELHHCPALERIHKNALPLSITKLFISVCPILFLPTTLHIFTSLRSLKLHDLPQILMLTNDAIPANLVKLQIMNCNIFKFFPRRLRLTSIQVLQISSCPEMKSITVHQLPDNLAELLVHDCEGLEFLTNEGIDNLTNLQTLQLTNCEKLSLLSTDLLSLTSLKELRIDYSPILESGFPTTLEKLKVWGHESLRSFPQQEWLQNLPSLRKLKIAEFPQLQFLPKDLPSSLQLLSICDCPTLTILPQNIIKLNSLKKLKVVNCQLSESFENGLPSKLVGLKIMNCQKLKYLPKNLNTLTCLESLSISTCPELELRLEDKLPVNLSALKITECPNMVLNWSMEHIPFRHIS